MSLEILFNYEKNHIKNKEDALVCGVHSLLISRGYKCIGKGEELPKGNVKKSDMLPPGWSSDQIYALVYQQVTTGDAFLLKIIKFDSLLLVHFMRMKDERVLSIEVRASDYIGQDLESFDTAFHNIDRFNQKLGTELLNVFDQKSKTSPRTIAKDPSRIDQNRPDQNRPDPRRDTDPCRCPPEWEDPRDPFSIGRSDLDPFAPSSGGGMYFDPMRTGIPFRGGVPPGIGGPSRLPRGAVPPGARFDPFGPPDVDPSGGMRPDYRNPRFGPDPDPDHLPPPGYDDMFH